VTSQYFEKEAENRPFFEQQLINNMEKLKLISRCIDPADNRQN